MISKYIDGNFTYPYSILDYVDYDHINQIYMIQSESRDAFVINKNLDILYEES